MNTTGRLKELGPGDPAWPKILQMDAQFFPRPWSYNQWMDLNMDHHRLFVWEDIQGVLAFALFGYIPGDDSAHLLKICLNPSKRGSGLADFMWHQMAQILNKTGIREVFLEVEEGNVRAQGFYRKLGFRPLRLLKAYYSDGANGLSMLLTL